MPRECGGKPTKMLMGLRGRLAALSKLDSDRRSVAVRITELSGVSSLTVYRALASLPLPKASSTPALP